MNKQQRLELAQAIGIPDIPDTLYIYGESNPDIRSVWESPVCMFTKLIVQECVQAFLEDSAIANLPESAKLSACKNICDRFGFDVAELL